jgi:heme/copper-type cytochrome/quinol oxidase subunit 4
MLMVILATPVCLLCFHLTYLCYRKKYYTHSLVIGGFAFVLLIFVVAMIGASYWTWEALTVDNVL